MLNNKRLLNTFLELVQIDSVSGEEKNICQFVMSYLKQLGLSPYQDEYGNIICCVDGVLPSIILTAHLDTVEPGRGIKPEVVNGVIVSASDTILGADNKVGVAAILETVTNLRESRENHHKLELIFTLSEEVGNLGANSLDFGTLESRNGYSFDGSGQVGGIVTASPFYNRFDIRIFGKAAHAGKPESAINALIITTKAINEINFGRIDEDTLCNIGRIEGGTVRNAIPGEVLVMGEVRSFIEEKLERQTTKIVETFKRYAKKEGGRIESVVVRENSGFKVEMADALIETAHNVLNKLSIPIVHIEATGCYDANVFFEHGIKIINFNNGSSKNHTTEEFISIKDLENTAKIALKVCTDAT